MCASALIGGLVTTMPTSTDNAKRMGKELIIMKGGELLSKLSGTYLCMRKVTHCTDMRS